MFENETGLSSVPRGSRSFVFPAFVYKDLVKREEKEGYPFFRENFQYLNKNIVSDCHST